MLNITKKLFSVFVALTTILWALGPFSIFINQAEAAASTAVAFSGCGGIGYRWGNINDIARSIG